MFEIIERNNTNKKLLDKFFRDNLQYTRNFTIDFSNHNLNYNKNVLKILFHNISNPISIFVGSINNHTGSEIYFLGLETDLKDKNAFKDTIKPRLVVSFNYSLKNSAIVFAYVDFKFNLCLKVNLDNLNEKEKCILKHKNKIVKFEENYYIVLGLLDNSINILRNLRNFISNCTFYHDSVDVVNIKSVHIPVDFDFKTVCPEIEDEIIVRHDKHSYCMLCGNKIIESYEINPEFKGIVGNNPNKCASCFSKILMAYFQNNVIDKFSNRAYLLAVSQNKDLIKFYLNICEKNNIIKRTEKINFSEDFQKEYLKFKEDIPKKSLLDPILKGKKGTSDIIDIIDEYTLENNRLSLSFEELLQKYNLSDDDGWAIRNQLIIEARKKKIKKTKKKIKQRIKHLINERYVEDDSLNLFELSDKLNKLTLNSKGDLNDDFKNLLKLNNLKLDCGWVIRRELINEIENNEININNFQKRFNELINIKMNQTKSSNNECDILKEYFILNDKVNLIAIIDKKEISNLLKIFLIIKQFSESHLEHLAILSLNDSFSKVFIEFIVKENMDYLVEVLNKNGFRKIF